MRMACHTLWYVRSRRQRKGLSRAAALALSFTLLLLCQLVPYTPAHSAQSRAWQTAALRRRGLFV